MSTFGGFSSLRKDHLHTRYVVAFFEFLGVFFVF